VLDDFGKPDPSIVGKLPKGGISLDFVGHADITKQLIQADPQWSWEPVEIENGLPKYTVVNGLAHMGGYLTVHGVTRFGVGSVAHNKPDIYKELVSDFLRNAAMRFGFALSLWSKAEWEDVDAPSAATPAKSATPKKNATNAPEKKQDGAEIDPKVALTEDQLSQFNGACTKADISPITVYKKAGVQFGHATRGDLPKLRQAFKELSLEKEGETGVKVEG